MKSLIFTATLTLIGISFAQDASRDESAEQPPESGQEEEIQEESEVRILEVSGFGKRVNATIEFLGEDDSKLGEAEMSGEAFDWYDVHPNARFYRIRVGGVPSQQIELPEFGHEFVSIRGLATSKSEDGATVVDLDIRPREVETVASGNKGVVYLGRLKSPMDQSSTWSSMYLVTREERATPDTLNDGTLEAVERDIIGKEMYLDFPLYLRQWDDSKGRPEKQQDDLVIRAGQSVLVQSLMIPDDEGNVYAEIEVR